MLPPPLWGRAGVGGERLPPTPALPPQGGREKRNPPHKGGRKRRRIPLSNSSFSEGGWHMADVFETGLFRGVDVNDAFARTASRENPVIVNLGPVSWPAGLKPVVTPFGSHRPGEKITEPLGAKANVLILIYTEVELRALLEVFTGDNKWDAARRNTWYPYAHNFDSFHIRPEGDIGLKAGIMGYLFALRIGDVKVVLYKTELHPKADGAGLPFVPVIKQLVGELTPQLVLSTGTAGAVGAHLNCGDVAITSAARFHTRVHYPSFPEISTLSQERKQLQNNVSINEKFIAFAGANFTKLSAPGLDQCYHELSGRPGLSFLKRNPNPTIFTTGKNNVPGPQPMDIVSADYLTVDDNHNSEGLQALGAMNDTDDAFAFFALGLLPAGKQPKWLSVRNASEPQIQAASFPPGTSPGKIIDALKATAGPIYGVYQYCTTLNSAFACWGIIAGLN